MCRVNEDGLGGSAGGDDRTQFVRHSLSYQHNRLWNGTRKFLFPPQVNDSDYWGVTQSYTNLVQLGPLEGVVMYEMGTCTQIPHANPPNVACALWPMASFAMRFSLSAKGALKTDEPAVGASPPAQFLNNHAMHARAGTTACDRTPLSPALE